MGKEIPTITLHILSTPRYGILRKQHRRANKPHHIIPTLFKAREATTSEHAEPYDVAIDSEMWQCSAEDHLCIICSNGLHADIKSRSPTNHDSGKA